MTTFNSKKSFSKGVVCFTRNIKYKLALVITILGIVGLVSGTSYAVLKGDVESEKEQVIRMGSVKLKLTENYENINKKITTLSDEEGLLQEEVYDFNIKNIGNLPAKYDIKLVNEVPSDYTGSVLSEEYVRIGLEINEEEYGPFSLSEVENIIDSNEIYEKEVINYRLRIWLDEEKQEELMNLEDYKSFLSIKVEAEQREESMDDGETTVFNYTGYAQEYRVPRDGWYYIEMSGAQGGSAKYTTSYSGGLGTKTSGYIELEANDKLYFYVGGMGSSHSGTATDTITANGNGYNGGSKGWFYANNSNGGGGGGATDVRLEKAEENEKYRYVRNYLNGSEKNTNNHWAEVQVYDINNNLISRGKTVSYNGTSATSGHTNPQLVTDGDLTSANYFDISGGTNTYIEIDLGAEYEIGYVKMYHYYSDGRTYQGNKVNLLNKDKTESVTIFDSDVNGTYAETSAGRDVYNVQYRESLISRIMVAGGGGGAKSHISVPSYSGFGGDGGALYGITGYLANATCYAYGTGGTQNSGGKNPNCSNWTTLYYYNGIFGEGNGYGQAGGGGGYYGGAAGIHGPGGGGSSYISGYAGVNSVEKSAQITHTKEVKHYSEKYFIGGKMLEGQNSGNGYAKITYVDNKPKRKNKELNNVRYIKNCESYNTYNSQNHWNEIQAIKDGVNIAKGKTAIGTTQQYNDTTRAYSLITDGDITYSGYGVPSSYATNQCITIDLEEEYDLDEVAVWNYFGDQRSYYDNITYVSSDNSNWKTIINDAVIETSNGHRINAYTDIYNGYIQDGLVLWYDGYANNGATRNTTTTTWKNLASSSYTGTVYSGTTAAATWYKDYLYLDGTDDWVKIAALNLNTPTVEMVFNKTAVTGETEEVMIGNFASGGYGLTYIRKQLAGEFNIGGTYYLIYKPMTLNKKEVLSTSYDKSTIKLYSNGAFYDKKDVAGTIQSPTNSTIMAIGANPDASTVTGGYYKGNVYSVRMYDRPLTEEEVYHNYMYDKERFNLE